MQTDHARNLAAALAPFAVYGRPGSRDVEVGAAIKALDEYLAAPSAAPTGHQTRLGSLIEALSNTAVGFGISMCINAAVMPAFGHALTLAQNFWITAIFTVASIARGYVMRRVFTRIKRLHA